MEGPRTESAGARFDGLHAEAAEALAYAANTLRATRDRYRQAYLDDLGRWQGLADDLGSLEHGDEADDGDAGTTEDRSADGLAATAAEAGAAGLRLRLVRVEVERSRSELAQHEVELSRLELAIRNLESTWLFLERGDASLVTEPALPSIATELQMRIVEAQEAERARLAQEIHDGPAQALSNAIFQAEFIERIFESDPRMARQELRFLRELLRRELGDVRGFIGHLRPPVLIELGLDGSIVDTVTTQAALSGMRITAELAAPAAGLTEAAQTVVLRVVQEALQNVRKHACRHERGGGDDDGRGRMGARGPR